MSVDAFNPAISHTAHEHLSEIKHVLHKKPVWIFTKHEEYSQFKERTIVFR